MQIKKLIELLSKLPQGADVMIVSPHTGRKLPMGKSSVHFWDGETYQDNRVIECRNAEVWLSTGWEDAKDTL